LMPYNPTQFENHWCSCMQACQKRMYLLHTLRIYSNFALFSGNIGLCYHESGNSALPDMSELVDQSDTSVWNCGTGAALN
ncbi:hypothetical protein T01_16258, partial [Trichinella spiralis]